MFYLSSILIFAALTTPGGEQRHIDAIEIFSCDFNQKDWDANYDHWPDQWRRKKGHEWPHYVKIHLKKDRSASQGQCLAVNLNGGAALVSSPAVPVSNKFNYVADAMLKTSQIKHSSVQVRVDFCDDKNQIVESATSEWFRGANQWTKVHIGPITIQNPAVQTAKISLYVKQGDYVDIKGEACLDNIWLARLPRMTVSSNSPFNVYDDLSGVVVTCALSGILEEQPDILFELRDASNTSLQEDTLKLKGRLITDEKLKGRLITDKLNKSSEFILDTVKRPSGYEGKTQWSPPIKKYGFYRVRVLMKTTRGVPQEREISLAVVPPIEKHGRGEFGWSLVEGQTPLSFQQLEQLLPRVGISWLKLPVWYSQSEPERGDELVRFTDKLAGKEIEVVGVVDRAPDDIFEDKRVAADITIADLLSGEDLSTWLPSLDAVLTRLSLRVRWWQLGTDQDTSYSSFPYLEDEIEKIRSKLFRFGQDVNLGIGWPWTKSTGSEVPASWDFQQLSATPSLTGSEIGTYLDLPPRSGVARWCPIVPLERGVYDLETRTRDLVKQMLAAKIHRADGIFLADPFNDKHGLMSSAGTPGELLLPWRTTAALLSGAKYLGTIRLPGGSNNRIFETSQNEVLMAVWSQNDSNEVIYLGENVRVIDAWGRSHVPEMKEHRQVVQVEALPKFVVGLNPFIAKMRISVNFTHKNIPSVFGSSHNNSLKIANPFEQGVGGSVRLVGPEGWQIIPNKIDYKLSTGEKAQRPFQIVLPYDANSGTIAMRADFELAADKKYKFSVYRDLRVGDDEIQLELHSHLEEDGSLVVEQRMINHGSKLVDFKCLLYTQGRRRQRTQVFRLGNKHDVKTYVYQNGKDLIGQELWLRAEELGGTRVLNHRIKIGD